MSLVPLLFSNWWEELQRPHRVWDQHFGSNVSPEELLTASMVDPRYNVALRNPLLYLADRGNNQRIGTGSSTIEADKDKFKVILDVQQFKPEEINVKVVDKFVTVEAEHEEQLDDHGWVSRKFVRKYLIPEQCNIDEVNSSLSSDGVLTITAPRNDLPKLENGRPIKIHHTGKPAIHSSGHHKQQTVKDSQHAVKDSQHAAKDSQHAVKDSQHAAKDSQHAAKDSPYAAKDSPYTPKNMQLIAQDTQPADTHEKATNNKIHAKTCKK